MKRTRDWEWRNTPRLSRACQKLTGRPWKPCCSICTGTTIAHVQPAGQHSALDCSHFFFSYGVKMKWKSHHYKQIQDWKNYFLKGCSAWNTVNVHPVPIHWTVVFGWDAFSMQMPFMLCTNSASCKNGLAFFTKVLQLVQKPAFVKTSASFPNKLKRHLTEAHCIVFNHFASLQALFVTLCKHVTLYNSVCIAVTLCPL